MKHVMMHSIGMEFFDSSMFIVNQSAIYLDLDAVWSLNIGKTEVCRSTRRINRLTTPIGNHTLHKNDLQILCTSKYINSVSPELLTHMFLIRTQHLIKTMIWLQNLGGIHIECHLSRPLNEVIYSVAYDDP